jgi:hypothetical protein
VVSIATLGMRMMDWLLFVEDLVLFCDLKRMRTMV